MSLRSREEIEELARRIIETVMIETPEGLVYASLYSEKKDLIKKVADMVEQFMYGGRV